MQPPLERQKIADVNEPWAIRERLIQVGWQQSRLSSADYVFWTHNFKKVGIERKETGDLMNSLGKRLENQFEEMMQLFDEKILLIEGTWKSIAGGSMMVTGRGLEYHPMSMVLNYLRTWQRKGITLELSPSMGYTIRRLNELYAYYQKPYHTGAVNPSAYPDDRVLAFPSGCRGKTGMSVLNRFGTLTKVGLASIGELKDVNGIGQHRAELVWSHFNKEVESETGQ